MDRTNLFYELVSGRSRYYEIYIQIMYDIQKKMYNNILLYKNIGLAILSDFYNKFIILGPLQREEIFSTPLLTALSWWLVFRSCRILPQS